MLWLLLVYFATAILLTTLILVLSHNIGERHKERATHDPFESGVTPTGTARLRFAAEFYLVAMFFVIFDLETVFVVGWAVAVREAGWLGYIEVVLFIGILMVSLIYLWKVGGLDWRTQRQRDALARRREGLNTSQRPGSHTDLRDALQESRRAGGQEDPRKEQYEST